VDKIYAKLHRAIKKAFKRKERNIGALKEWINTNSVTQGAVVEGILSNPA